MSIEPHLCLVYPHMHARTLMKLTAAVFRAAVAAAAAVPVARATPVAPPAPAPLAAAISTLSAPVVAAGGVPLRVPVRALTADGSVAAGGVAPLPKVVALLLGLLRAAAVGGAQVHFAAVQHLAKKRAMKGRALRSGTAVGKMAEHTHARASTWLPPSISLSLELPNLVVRGVPPVAAPKRVVHVLFELERAPKPAPALVVRLVPEQRVALGHLPPVPALRP